MLTGIVLTYNEELHIERCINSLRTVCSRICIVDSFSTDRTCEIAISMGCDVFKNPWENNHAKQWNWAFQNCLIRTPWIIRMDADEYLLPELSSELSSVLPNISNNVSGIEINRRVYFKGKWIRFGGIYPIKLIRVFRLGCGICEQRCMDEHIVITKGLTIKIKGDIVDENLNNIFWWTSKHNNYARREAADLIVNKYKLDCEHANSSIMINSQAKRKRFLKERIYAELSLGFRAFLYFLYRYIFLFGFLDGSKGFLFHFLQGFWYRLLVDVNVDEFEVLTRNALIEEKKLYLKKAWNIDC